MPHRFNTKAIHAGQPNEELTGAVTTPVFQTSTFGQTSPGRHSGFNYSRTANPTRQALEECLAALEEGEHCVALASGLAAVSTCLNLLGQGDHIVACRDLYGGTYRQFTKVYSKFGLEFSFVDTTDLDAVSGALRPNSKLLWLESPSNPLLRITDIEAATEIAHEHGALALVDNTFATPCLQQPLSLGADIVLHSTTKYLNGHSDVIGGALITSNRSVAEELRFYQNAVGAVPAPMDCYLTLRGIKTLVPRMETHCRNAASVARYLDGHPAVRTVHYPGLDSHPGHETAARQQSDFGAIVSFELDGGLEQTIGFAGLLSLFTLAESLGSVKSLFCHPATMTHASVEPEVRKANGISDSLIRLSVGIEHVDDLLDDLELALSKVPAKRKVGYRVPV